MASCEHQTGTSPSQFRATGVVKYDGIPVASGRITFAPDNSQGNKGPAGWAMIQAGAYDTAGPRGQSPVSCPMTVIITGYGEPPAKNVETQEPLFQRLQDHGQH